MTARRASSASSAGDRRHRIVVNQRVRHLAADLRHVREVVLAGEDARAAGAHAVALGAIPLGAHVGIVQPP